MTQAQLLELVLATANPDKAAEIRAILASAMGDRLRLLERPGEVPDVEETGSTLEENARLKALALCAATGLPAVADDSGLEVQALGGAPGVYSARFSGPGATYASNVAKVLDELRLRGAEAAGQRRARFRTVALVRWPDGSERLAEGAIDGTIAEEPRGENGFGYDPIFIPDGAGGRTFSELSAADKHLLSHRGTAFRSLAEMLVERPPR